MRGSYRLALFLIVVIALLGIYFYQQNKKPGGIKGTSEEASDKLVVSFLDVGQGDATLIRTPEGNDILIDGGPDNTVIKKLGEYLPFGDWDIELMILTHPHADHVTGLIEVLERFEVDKVLTTGVLHSAGYYNQWQKIIAEKDILVEIIDHPQQECVEEDVCLDILFPYESFDGQKIENLNNASIVAKLIYVSTSVMLMGDYENEESLTGDLKANILKAGHHGSNNANAKEFVEMVSPDYAVVSVGADNYYGHPHYRSLKNFERFGAEIFRTDRDGDIRFISDGNKFEMFMGDY